MLSEIIILFFIESWRWLTAIGIAVGLIVSILNFSKIIKIKDSQRVAIKTITGLFICFILLNLIIGNAFTSVPILTGKTIKEAHEILNVSHLSLSLSPNEKFANDDAIILGQSNVANKPILKGATILVYTQNEENPESNVRTKGNFISVPNVVGLEQTQAIDLLASKGLQFQVWWTKENNFSSEKYYVIGQSIPIDSKVPENTIVQLEISPYKP